MTLIGVIRIIKCFFIIIIVVYELKELQNAVYNYIIIIKNENCLYYVELPV